MKQTLLIIAMLAACLTVEAQTLLRVSNAVNVAYFTNDDSIIIYRGTNPPYVLRGSNLIATLRQFFLTNAQPPSAVLTNASGTGVLTNASDFVPAGMSNSFLKDLNGAQPTNPILSALSGGMGYDQTIVSHPITGQLMPAGGDWLYFSETFKTYSAAAWPADRPVVVSGTATYSYRPINMPEVSDYIGGLWLWVTNWPGRLTYAYYGPGNTFSGSGPMRLRTNSWFDIQFRHIYGGHDNASTNIEVYAGWTDAPGLAAGTMPREGAVFIRRPAGTGPACDWAAVCYKANAVVASNRLGWASSSNEWVRLTIMGSSNSLVWLTNGVPAITNAVTFTTNRLFPTVYLRNVVTNTGSAFHSNSVWIDRLSVKE